MNGEVVDSCTPVRRSARTRKPNSRFAADELDGCIRKIVTGVEASKSEVKKTDISPITASPVGRKRGRKKDSKSEDEQGNSDKEKDGKKAEDDKEMKDDSRVNADVETKIVKKAKHSGTQERDCQTKGEGEKLEDKGSNSSSGAMEEEDKDKTPGKDNDTNARKLRKGRSSRRTSERENETTQVQETPLQESFRKKTKEEVERNWKEETERLKRKMEEEMRLKKEEEDEKRRRRQEEEKRKKKAEEEKKRKLLEALKKEEEEKKKMEEEENRKRKEEENKIKEEEENRKKEEEIRKKKEEENKKRNEEESKKRKEEEEIRRKKEEELIRKKKEEEENKKRIQEENKKKKEENRKKKEEEKRKEEENKKKKEEEENRRRKEEEENRKRKEEEENRKRKEEEENMKRKEEEEKKRKEEEENKKRKEEEENKKRKEEEDRKRKEEEENRKRKEEEENRKRKEEEENRKRKEEEENRKRHEEEEKKKKNEEENRRKMEEEKRKEEASRKNKEEENRKRKEEENRKSKEEENKRKEEEIKKKNEEKRKEEENKKRKEEEVSLKEEEQVKKNNEEQNKKRKEEDGRVSVEEEKNKDSEEDKRKGETVRKSEESKRKFEMEENQKDMNGKDKRKKEEGSNGIERDGKEVRKTEDVLTNLKAEEKVKKDESTQGKLRNEAKAEKAEELEHGKIKERETSPKKEEKESSVQVTKRKREQDKADEESAPSPRRTRQSSKDEMRKLGEPIFCSSSDSSAAKKNYMVGSQEGLSGSHNEGGAKPLLISAKDVNSSADLSKPSNSVNITLSHVLSEENNGKGQSSSLGHSFMNGDIQHSFNKYGDDFIPGLGEDADVSLLTSDSFHKDRDKLSDGKEHSKHKNTDENDTDFYMKGKRLGEQWKGEGNSTIKEAVEENLHHKVDKNQENVVCNIDADVTKKVANTGNKLNVVCVNSKEIGKEENGETGSHSQVGRNDGKSSSSTRVRKSRWNTVQTSASEWKGVDSVKAIIPAFNQSEVKRSASLTTNAEESTVNKRASSDGAEERPSKRNRNQDVKSMCMESIGENKFKRNQKESDSKECVQVVKLAVRDTESSVSIKEGSVSRVKNETEPSTTLPAAHSNQDGESGITASKHISHCDIKKEEDSLGYKVDEFGGSGKELKLELEVVENKENVIPKCEEPGSSEVDSSDKMKYSEDGKQKIKATEDEERMQIEKEEIERRNREVVEKRLKSFVHLEDNLYVTEKRRSKRSKEVRRMVCDCTLTKEEVIRGEKGCGEDCLNRLLMIECGSRCPLRDQCMNKRFQQHGYAKVEVFNAEEKGCGVRTMESLVPGTFIMEYVGEVFDTKEFKRRKKEYAREKNAHFYFMALKSDELIDATRKGNISRFINHSCDPNAETQKWTVNGDLRIGFFATKPVEAGEEITFDYRLERYGREPQKCYCGAANCRGWLGESPDEKTKEEKDEERKREERDKRKRDEKRSYFEDMDLEEEIEKLNSHHLRNRQDTLTLSRLMVRAEDFDSRVALLRLLQLGEQACRRLFLDYHGLRLLWSWMVDQTSSLEHNTLKLEILRTLECLPVTNKTQLTDSRVLGLVEKWSTQVPDNATSASLPPPPPPASTVIPQYPDDPLGKKISENSEDSSDTETDNKGMNNAMDSPAVDDSSSLDSQEATPKHSEESSDSNLSFPTAAKEASKEESEEQNSSKKLKTEEQDAKKVKEGGVEEELLQLQKQIMEMSLKLLESWKHLKEAFRIPKKERIELMKEHEREVDRGYKEYLDKQRDRDRDRDRDRRDRDRYVRYYERRRRSPDRDRDRDRYRRNGRNDRERENREDRATDSPKLSKEERRQLFALKVQQEEEEAKQRKMQEEMWTLHVDRCRMLGQDPYLTPIFDPSYQYYWDPVSSSWQPYTGPDPSIPVPAGYGKKADGDISEGSPLAPLPQGQVVPGQAGHLGILGQGVVLPGQGVPGIPGVKVSEVEVTLPGLKDDDPLDPANIPLPGEVSTAPPQTSSPSQAPPDQAVPVEGTPPQGAKVIPVQWCSVDGAGKPPALPLPAEGNPSHALLDPTNPLTLPLVLAEDRVAKCPPPGPITVQLPPKWKMARDSEGHVYFYHIKTRRSQWEPPTWEQHQQIEAELGSDSDSDLESSDDSDSSSSSDSEEFSSDEEEEEEKVEQSEEVPEEKMIKRPPSHKKKRSEALVQERVISPILEIDREAARRERREAKERAREEARQERREERRTQATVVKEPVKEPKPVTKEEKIKSKERAATAIADNSELARKIKDNFRSKMATYIVSVLNPYRKSDCKKGRITSTEDFKYLARKLTHFVMVKELKQLKSIESLDCSDSVKHKTRDFVRKYMGKYGSTFKRDPNDTKEY